MQPVQLTTGSHVRSCLCTCSRVKADVAIVSHFKVKLGHSTHLDSAQAKYTSGQQELRPEILINHNDHQPNFSSQKHWSELVIKKV